MQTCLKATALGVLCLLSVACTPTAEKSADSPKPAISATPVASETEATTTGERSTEETPQGGEGKVLAQSWTLINFGAPW